MGRRHWITLAAVLCTVGCGTSDRFADGGPDDPGEPDAGGADVDAGGATGAPFGAACERNADCSRLLVCDTEIDQSYLADNLPPDLEAVPSAVFPGGQCSPLPAAVYDPLVAGACDPLAPVPHQGCGATGVCVVVGVDQDIWVACRPQCEPSDDESGCDRSFYTCDFDVKGCVEGCQSDAECRLALLDTDGDAAADALAYDDESRATCDPATYRCTHPGSGGGQTGDPCERLDDCEPDGTCIQPAQTFAAHPFPDGVCTKLGCDVEGRECQGEDVACARLRSFSPGLLTPTACLRSCVVGAEPEADRLGPDGHGAGCRAGYRCHYNGGEGAESGVCVGGNYNAVAEPNLGAACETDAGCHSPFGLGSCLLLSVGTVQPMGATCAIMDCAAPGLPDDICGENGVCIGLSGDLTLCVQTCTDATSCAEGYACTDDDGDVRTSKICYPACLTDEDCRKDTERCNLQPEAGFGACVAL